MTGSRTSTVFVEKYQAVPFDRVGMIRKGPCVKGSCYLTQEEVLRRLLLCQITRPLDTLDTHYRGTPCSRNK
jgi:hypothetical protein